MNPHVDLDSWRYRLRTANQSPSTAQAFDKLCRDLIAELEQLHAQRDAVLALAAAAEHGARRWADPLPVPAWVGQVRAALTAP